MPKQRSASDENIAQVGGRWFPCALLMDINSGHLNLAEAVLEMSGGEPLSTASLMEQIDLPQDANTKLTYDLPNQGQLWGTFSFNRSSQGDLFAQGIDLLDVPAVGVAGKLGPSHVVP